MSDKQEPTEAFVLRRTDYKDSDRILTLFTKAHGKISVSARGARKSTKRFAGALEPFVLLEVAVASSKTGRRLHQLMESSVLRGADGLSKRMARLNAASFAVEMFRESIPEESPDDALFDLLDETMARLCDLDGAELRKTVAAFQLKLLSTIGFGVSVSRCAGCGLAVPPGRPVYFHPARGGVICTACGGGPMLLSAASASVMNEMARAPMSHAARIPLGEEDERQTERALTAFIEHHLAKPLRTRDAFFRT